MSIVRTALRLATLHAITGRTWLDDRIEDSSIDTLENALTNEPQTICLIYTEDTMARPTGKDLWPNGTVDLVLLISVAGAFNVKLEDSEEKVVEYRYPTTDRSSELTIDVIERQIKTALMDPGNEWSEIWKGLVTSVEYWNSQRGATNKQGVRFAARQITARLHVIDEPVPGKPPVGAWAKLTEKLEAEGVAKLGPVVGILRNLIQGAPIPADYRDGMQNGLTRAQLASIGLDRVDVMQDGDDPDRLDSYAVQRLDPGRPE